jgi:hypothetical protein
VNDGPVVVDDGCPARIGLGAAVLVEAVPTVVGAGVVVGVVFTAAVVVVAGAALAGVVTDGVVVAVGEASAKAVLAITPDDVATATPALIAARHRRVRPVQKLGSSRSRRARDALGSRTAEGSPTGTRPGALNVKWVRGLSATSRGSSKLMIHRRPNSPRSSRISAVGQCCVRVINLRATSNGSMTDCAPSSTWATRRRAARRFRTGI